VVVPKKAIQSQTPEFDTRVERARVVCPNRIGHVVGHGCFSRLEIVR
jgi:hypothetical protein